MYRTSAALGAEALLPLQPEKETTSAIAIQVRLSVLFVIVRIERFLLSSMTAAVCFSAGGHELSLLVTEIYDSERNLFFLEGIMDNLLRDVPLFVEVAKHKSFTRAAEALDMYISTLSRRIALLERELGVPLFHRSTRQVELTDSGRVLYERCSQLLAEIEDVYDEVALHMTRAAGPVRIAVPADIYHSYLWGVSGKFARKWPEINLRVSFTQRWVDLLSEPYDLDIRVGPMPSSDLRTRKLVSMRPGLYATDEFLRNYPTPQTPQDLKAMPCIGVAQHGNAWTMTKGKKTETVVVETPHIVNSISLSLELALADLGIAWLAPSALEHPYLATVSLVHVLPGWTVPGIDINVVMSNRELPHRVRLFVDHLVDHFASVRH